MAGSHGLFFYLKRMMGDQMTSIQCLELQQGEVVSKYFVVNLLGVIDCHFTFYRGLKLSFERNRAVISEVEVGSRK